MSYSDGTSILNASNILQQENGAYAPPLVTELILFLLRNMRVKKAVFLYSLLWDKETPRPYGSLLFFDEINYKRDMGKNLPSKDYNFARFFCILFHFQPGIQE